MELKIENDEGLVLWTGSGELVQVPMDTVERAQCRKALLDALILLDQTIVKRCTFSTAAVTDQCEPQSPQHLSDCLAIYDFSRPSKQPKNSQEPRLRLVSADPQ
ncbi:hypothetical protein [Tritonibacter mobilis]|uniref:hypothetical protein n=1 Tax=Tritonibacter mobilis TaxID=379347 RepID=UPI0013A6830B|nr:hypothetical protein [Tritonibacter mobilis]